VPPSVGVAAGAGDGSDGPASVVVAEKRSDGVDGRHAVGVDRVAVSVIAVPHVVVGSYLDRTRGIWSV